MTDKPKTESKAAAPAPKMRVKQVPIAKLVPYARNARQHTQALKVYRAGLDAIAIRLNDGQRPGGQARNPVRKGRM